MIIRIVLLFLIVAAVLWLLKKLFSGGTEPTDIPQAPKNKSENMIQCKFCGIHSPESIIVIHRDQNYCCQDHADQDQ
ncbi:MAG: hypothetical protein ACI9CO_000798 [Candidatus Azotimanducaceae bacterium]|jgi:uncharacterized protein